MRTGLVRTVITAVVVAAGALTAVPSGALSLPRPVPQPAPAVLGLVDSGINAYHVTFRDSSKRAQQYPGTYVPGYPKGAIALKLSLNEKDYDTAVRKDCARVWSKVKPGQLYWFPGTRIIGAISWNAPVNVDCGAAKLAAFPILDVNGHGTMVASRAASGQYGACPTCLIVAAQHPGSVNLGAPGESTKPSVGAVRWLAKNNAWIDAQSNSWGPLVPGYDPTGRTGLVTANPEVVRTVEEASKAHLAFWASGNGAAFRGGILGHPSLLTPHLGPSAIIVGGHDSGYVATWPGFTPHVVSDGCASWAAKIKTMKDSGDSVGSGTSAATPFVAGAATQILSDARTILGDKRTGVRAGGVVASGRKGVVKAGPLADGVLTLEEWRTVTLKTATRRPVKQYEDGPPCSLTGLYDPTPVQWTQVPDQFPEYTLIGYGAVDRPSIALAGKVLRGQALPDRAATDQYFAADRQVREVTYDVYSTP